MPYQKIEDEINVSPCAEPLVEKYLPGIGKKISNPLAFTVKMREMQAELIDCHMQKGNIRPEDQARAEATLAWLERGGLDYCTHLEGKR